MTNFVALSREKMVIKYLTRRCIFLMIKQYSTTENWALFIRVWSSREFFSENADDTAGESAKGSTKIARRPAVADGAKASSSSRERAWKATHERIERRLRQVARGRAESRDWSQAQQVRNSTNGTELHSRPVRSSAEAR